MSRSRPRVLSRCSFQIGLGTGLAVSGVGEQAGLAGARAGLQPLRQRQRDLPVVPRLARCGHGRAHAADAALAVGDGAVLLAPGGGRAAAGRRTARWRWWQRLLHHYKLGTLQGAAHGVWSGRLCAGLVHAIHSALISPSAAAWNSSTALPGPRGHRLRHPTAGPFGALRGVGHIAVRGQQVGQPPTSRPPMALGWPVRLKGPAPGRPIWPQARCRWISARSWPCRWRTG